MEFVLAVGTVRRFIEKYNSSVDLVVFVVAGEYVSVCACVCVCVCYVCTIYSHTYIVLVRMFSYTYVRTYNANVTNCI